jgi:hypothetical protein
MCRLVRLGGNMTELPKMFHQPIQNLSEGYFLEYALLMRLRNMSLFDDVIHEECLRKQWGWSASGVDHFIVFGEYAIPIQTKWRNTRRRENSGVDNFLKSVEYTITKTGKKMLFGLWASKLQPFSDNQARLAQHNIVCISELHSIEQLVTKVCETIAEKIKHLSNRTVCV